LMSDVPMAYCFLEVWFFYHVRRCQKICAKRIESDDTVDLVSTIAFFSVGLEGSWLGCSPKSSRSYWNDSPRNKFTIQEGLDAVKDVIYNLETYDVTTIRASTPMWLMARVIKSMGIKMVLSGEADELFWYLYFPQSSKCSRIQWRNRS
jgi:asparagine synthase (glutamine-hydrolysing)